VDLKRRFVVGLVTLVLVAPLGLLLLLPRDDLQKDGPRLVVLGRALQGGRRVVRFRFEAPKHKDVRIGWASIITHYSSLPAWGAPGDPDRLWIRAGTAKEFSVIDPNQSLWQLRLEVFDEDKRLRAWISRLRYAWQVKRLSALQFRIPNVLEYVTSDSITNAAPGATATSR
jgi:hypothetical protein